jgi:hypothetical protein
VVGTSPAPATPPPPVDQAARNPEPVTGFDPDDDLALESLRNESAAAGYDGPYPIINVALNLVHVDDPAWQERKAESFVLTPRHCGSETTGYRPTGPGNAGYAEGVKLGTALAISGAAASPNMGYHSSAAVTFLLTVVNARLGAWLGNPKHHLTWHFPGPWFGYWNLFREMFGWTDDRGPYVYLSDGGHFENLAVYELVRRRCHYVVVCDAGQDGDHGFEDLGNLIRKVRIDQGIRIEIKTDMLRLQGEPRRCRWHCAIGTIRYDEIDDGASPGTLVYVKPTLTGDEPADVLNYASGHPTFPHESTGNQFYTESQFESYRALGQHVAEAVFALSKSEMDDEVRPNPSDGEAPGVHHRRRCRALFASLVRRWFAMPPEYEATFIESTHGVIDVHEAFRDDPRLWRLTLDLYPEMDPAGEAARQAPPETPDQQAARRCAEVHVIAQMLQVMENAWLSLNLDVNYAHPLNRGWMDLFHRWTSAETVRRHWPLLRAEYGRGFVSFCEKQMRLGVVTGKLVELGPETRPERYARLFLEFEDQWPDQIQWLQNTFQAALDSRGALGWSIEPHNPYPRQEELAAAGIILVTPVDQLVEHGPATYQLFVWMRGAYRNTGLGRSAVRDVLQKLQARWANTFRLRVILPVKDLTGPGGKLQKGMWLTFFTHHEFVRLSTPRVRASADEDNIELERVFPGTESA